ncbi:MAG: recombinase family protein [bacterium]|nr:recombinase family protein [bacterium]
MSKGGEATWACGLGFVFIGLLGYPLTSIAGVGARSVGEVTGERIRDKIAASKRKGLWMGGRVPLGYRSNGRTLEISESEAGIVRRIYDLYETEKSVTRVAEEVSRLGLRTKVYVDKRGRTSGGKSFSRGHIHRLLANPIYAGCISHKGAIYEGQHRAIIDVATWERTQSVLNAGAPAGERRSSPSLLRGKLFDATGAPFTPSHTVKSGRRYRHYVSRPALPTETSDACSSISRLPAGDIEKLVSETVAELLSDRRQMSDLLRGQGVGAAVISSTLGALSSWRGNPVDMVRRVDVTSEKISIELDISTIAQREIPLLRLNIATRIQKRRSTRRIVRKGDTRSRSRCLDLALLNSVARTRCWFEAISTGRVRSFAEIAAAEGVSEQYVGKLMSPAWLSPEIVEGVVDGTDFIEITTEALTSKIDIPAIWGRQRLALEIRDSAAAS